MVSTSRGYAAAATALLALSGVSSFGECAAPSIYCIRRRVGAAWDFRCKHRRRAAGKSVRGRLVLFRMGLRCTKSIITQCHHVDGKLSIAMAMSREMGVNIVEMEMATV